MTNKITDAINKIFNDLAINQAKIYSAIAMCCSTREIKAIIKVFMNEDHIDERVSQLDTTILEDVNEHTNRNLGSD